MSKLANEWTELRRIADELELKIHLAGMDARDRWQALKPRFADIERKLAHAGERATEVVQDEVTALGKALNKLREELSSAAR